jgi:phospholipase C
LEVVVRKSFGLLLVMFLSAFAIAQIAQTNIPQIQHVIVIVQENRTIDNLFGGDSALAAAGAHLQATGSCHGTSITLSPFRLDACFDNSHSHTSWESAWDNTVVAGGAMDGDCDVHAGLESGITPRAPAR